MIRIRKHGTVIASFATPQEIVIDHANDDIRLGDGTNLMGTMPNSGGVRSLPVHIQGAEAGSLALDSTLTDGTQKTKLVNGSDTAEFDTVGAEKALKVSVISSVGGGSAPAETDGAAWTADSSLFTPIGAVFDDVAPTALGEGEMGTLRSTAARSLNVNLAEGISTLSTAAKQDTIIGHLDGVEGILATINTSLDNIEAEDFATQTTLAAILVDTGQIEALLTTIDADTGNLAAILTALQLIDNPVFVDDAAFTAATSSVMVVGGQYQSTPNALDDGDAGSILLDANHAVQAVLRAGTAAFGKLAANSGVDIGDVDVTSMTCAAANAKVDIGLINAVTPLMGNGVTGTGSLRVTLASDNTANSNPFLVGGQVAHDAAVSGNPLHNGFTARLTTLPAIVSTADDMVKATADGYGRQLAGGPFPCEGTKYQVTNVTNTTQTTVVTADANNCLDIIAIVITNNSDVQSTAAFKDSTSGTTRLLFLVPARGGVVFTPCMPIPQLAAKNNNWTVTMGTTATSTDISIVYGLRPT